MRASNVTPRALAARGDHVDAIGLEEPCPSLADRVSLFGIPTARYRGGSRGRYLSSYAAFLSRAAARALKLSRSSLYDVAVVCTPPDLAIISALPLRALRTRLCWICTTQCPSCNATSSPDGAASSGPEF